VGRNIRKKVERGKGEGGRVWWKARAGKRSVRGKRFYLL
jgi:hypothetical protein